VDDLSRERAKRNEAVFRAVNEEIDDRRGSSAMEYVCECADPACSETIVVGHVDYEAVRNGGDDRFLVVPGHEREEIERVVARHDRYLVVEKL
jgi:hypothetical protein